MIVDADSWTFSVADPADNVAELTISSILSTTDFDADSLAEDILAETVDVVSVMFSNIYGLATKSWTLRGNQPLAPRKSGVPPRISVNAWRRNAPMAMTIALMMTLRVICHASSWPGGMST